MRTSDSIRKKHKKYLFDAIKNFYKEPLVIEKGKGFYVSDSDGNLYLDFFGGILTVSVGHANDEVNTAVKAQVDRLSHISSLYPSIPVVELAPTSSVTFRPWPVSVVAPIPNLETPSTSSASYDG